MEKVAPFAQRVHIDLTDGVFAPSRTVSVAEVWWPAGIEANLHVMYKRPFERAAELLALKPKLIIVHAEAEGRFAEFARRAHQAGVQVGVALTPPTPVEVIRPALDTIDHVLVFSGDLGHFGGRANTHLLTKVSQLKRLKPGLEVGWDGGVNSQNAAALAAGGVDVLNAGGFIQRAGDPTAAYQALRAAAQV